MDRREFVVGGLAAVAAPNGVEAQQAAKIPRVGFLSTGKKVPPEHPYLVAIADRLRDAGYVVGHDIIVDWQFAENDPEKVPELVASIHPGTRRRAAMRNDDGGPRGQEGHEHDPDCDAWYR